MAIPSGLGAQLGIATETRYGTFAAPVTFQRIQPPTLLVDPNYFDSFELGGQGLVQASNLHAQTTRTAGGDIPFTPLDMGLGKWLNLLHGNVVTPGAMTGGLWRQLHNIGLTAPTGKSASIQVGMPQVDGTVQPFSYVGSKVVNAVFRLAVGGAVTVTFAIDAQDEDVAQTLGTATYPAAAKVFNFINASGEFDDVLIADCITEATITIPIPMKTDRFCIGGGALKKEPVVNAEMQPTAELAMEFSSMTNYTAFRAARLRKFELNCAGSTTSGTYKSALNFALASTDTIRGNPTISGPDILTQNLTLKVLNDSTNAPVAIEYISQDSAL